MYNRRGQLIRRSRKTRSFYETFWYQKQNMTIANSSTYESSIRHNCKSEFATSQVSCCVWLSVSHFYTWCSAFLWILVKAFIISCLGDFFCDSLLAVVLVRQMTHWVKESVTSWMFGIWQRVRESSEGGSWVFFNRRWGWGWAMASPPFALMLMI